MSELVEVRFVAMVLLLHVSEVVEVRVGHVMEVAGDFVVRHVMARVVVVGLLVSPSWVWRAEAKSKIRGAIRGDDGMKESVSESDRVRASARKLSAARIVCLEEFFRRDGKEALRDRERRMMKGLRKGHLWSRQGVSKKLEG